MSDDIFQLRAVMDFSHDFLSGRLQGAWTALKLGFKYFRLVSSSHSCGA